MHLQIQTQTVLLCHIYPVSHYLLRYQNFTENRIMKTIFVYVLPTSDYFETTLLVINTRRL